MLYRRMGRSGLQLSALSLGSWVTFGRQVGRGDARSLIAAAFDAGVNFFDNAEVYGHGESERVMGDVLADLRLPRDAYCVSSKVFFGSAESPRPTQRGLSRKHVADACHAALRRLRVDYLDLFFAHRADPETPVEETVLAMDLLVRQGKVLYWGTSEWPAHTIEAACRFAGKHGLIAPSVEQPQYNLLHRSRVELEYAPLYAEFGLGTTTWSPLASGLLTGKYQDGIAADSRLAQSGLEWLRDAVIGEGERSGPQRVARFVEQARVAGVAPAQLAIAWCLCNPHVSTVILGATRIAQLEENLDALALFERMDRAEIERIGAAVEPVTSG